MEFLAWFAGEWHRIGAINILGWCMSTGIVIALYLKIRSMLVRLDREVIPVSTLTNEVKKYYKIRGGDAKNEG